MMTQASMGRDANYVPIQSPFSFLTKKTIVMNGATTGATGDHTIFTVTGDCTVQSLVTFPVTVASAGGTANLSLSAIGNAAGFFGPISEADTVHGKVLIENTIGVWVTFSSLAFGIVTSDIYYTVDTEPFTSGTMNVYILWSPLSDDGNIKLA